MTSNQNNTDDIEISINSIKQFCTKKQNEIIKLINEDDDLKHLAQFTKLKSFDIDCDEGNCEAYIIKLKYDINGIIFDISRKDDAYDDGFTVFDIFINSYFIGEDIPHSYITESVSSYSSYISERIYDLSEKIEINSKLIYKLLSILCNN